MDFLKQHRWWIISFAGAVILVGGYRFLFSPPSNFPSGSIVVISEGTTAPDIAKELSDVHIVAHQSLLLLLLRVSGTDKRISSGAYRFQTPENVFVVAYRLVAGDFGLPLVRITFPEGTTVHDDAVLVADAFPELSTKDFISAGKSYEGYLFPDTYFFPSGTDIPAIVDRMRANFDAKMIPLSWDIRSSGHSLSDIVIMASLIEKEARTDTDKYLVAGILWNRLKINMPLQVDAANETYKHKGLPATPICNPGLESIEAALQPTKTDYFYYLTGHDGLMHYSTTFAGHQSNLKKYLK